MLAALLTGFFRSSADVHDRVTNQAAFTNLIA
jgi:hypothetical protein